MTHRAPNITEQKLQMVASSSSSISSLNNNNNGSSGATVNSNEDDYSEGMATAVTPVASNFSNRNKEDVSESFPTEEQQQQQQGEVSGPSFDDSDSDVHNEEEEVVLEEGSEASPDDAASDSDEQHEDNDNRCDENQEDTIKKEEESNLLETLKTGIADNTAATIEDDPQADAVASTDVMYSFPTDQDEYEKVDSDVQSHDQSAPSQVPDEDNIVVDCASVVFEAIQKEDDNAGIECPPAATTPVKSPVLEMELPDGNTDSAAPCTPLFCAASFQKENAATPETTKTASSAPSDSSYTDDDSSSSNFSSDGSHFTVLEDSFEEQNPSILPAGIVQLFMRKQQEQHTVHQVRQRKLRRRKQLEMSREKLAQDSEEDEELRRPPPPRRRRPLHPSNRSSKTKKNVQYSYTCHYRCEDDNAENNRVPENRKARKAPLNDDYMLQEEIWLNMCCNAIPPYVIKYLKAFGLVKVQTVNQPQPLPPKKYRQPYVTDAEYIEQRRPVASPKDRRNPRLEQESPLRQDEDQLPYSISYDENSELETIDTVSTTFTGLYDGEEVGPQDKQQEAERLLQALELKKPTGDYDLTTITEEGEDSYFLERSLDVIVDYPPNQPPTFAC